MRTTAGAVLTALLVTTVARAVTVQVTVTNVRNDHGHVMVALCTKADFLQPNCPWRGRAAAQLGQVHVRIDGVPPGLYAAQAFHDEDDNGVLERSIFGFPREAMGFSNDAPMRMGPPSFDAAAFAVGASGTAITFRLR